MTVDVGLLLLADGRLPTGGHAHAAGVEAAVRIGDVRDAATLERYLRGRLATTGRVDAAFAASACAARRRPPDATEVLVALDAEYSARTPSPYLRQVSRQLGRQLLRTACRVWPAGSLDGLAPDDPHQPIALGAVVAAAGGEPDEAAVITIHHLAGAVVTGGIRLLGLDPAELAAVQLSAASDAVERLLPVLDPASDPASLPAAGGTLTEILGEHHGSLDARLFVA